MWCAEVRCELDGFGGSGQQGREGKEVEFMLVHTPSNLVVLAVVRGALHAGIRSGIRLDCRGQDDGAAICTGSDSTLELTSVL